MLGFFKGTKNAGMEFKIDFFTVFTRSLLDPVEPLSRSIQQILEIRLNAVLLG
ncbi:MAG: hypothetical protein ACJAUJ_001789 [Salibacteraceae bacterium]